jgi:hypothetical protein
LKKLTILLILLFKSFGSFGQKNPVFSFGASNISVGSTYGVRPNYDATLSSSYFFGEVDQAIRVKGVPIKISGRLSDEPYRSGRPSYFRISYDSYSYKKYEITELNNQLDSLNIDKQIQLDSLYKLEGKMSYLKQIQIEQAAFHLDSLNNPLGNIGLVLNDSLSLPSVPDLNGVNINSISLPNQNSIDLNELELTQLSIDQQKEKLAQIDTESLKLKVDINNLHYKTNLGFLQGIRKFDVGLSSLSPSSLSNNAIPIQGLHAAGVFKKMFYDVAAGFTLKNQLFSNQVFDQLLTNSVNVFNLGSFFSTNNVRFVSSAIVGIGEKDKNCIAVENFYTGRPFEDIRNHVSSPTTINNALTAAITPKKLERLTLTASIGQSSIVNDTNPVRINDKLAYKGGLRFVFPKIHGTFESMYRSIGSEYNGFSQGVYINNSTHGEFTYKQDFGSRIKTAVRYSEDHISAQDTSINIRKTKQGAFSLNWKVLNNTVLTATYSLVDAVGDTLIRRYSHLGQLGLNNTIQLKNNSIINSLNIGYASISGKDSVQQITQLSWQTDFKAEKWFAGVKVSYDHFSGVQRVYGDNYIFQPEIGFNLKDADLSLAYQYLRSEQFSSDNGILVNFNYRPSEYISWHFSAQKWLVRDTYFFMQNVPNFVKPYFIKVSLSIHLNVKK